MDEARHFVYKLIPPRPTIDVDATEHEQAIFGQHTAYWQRLMEGGNVLIFGPVSAPSGAWGLAVVQAGDEQDIHEIGRKDPAVTSGMCTYEVGSMPVAFLDA